MIFITGDTHGYFKSRFNTKNFPEQYSMTKNDYVIIVGDFGGIWDARGETKEEKHWLDWFDTRRYTLLFIDGNHENFDRLYNYPVIHWHGGYVHQIRNSVYHLMRGQVYNLCGKTVFTFGGARSSDVAGGIFESRKDPRLLANKKWLHRNNVNYRINHESWWAQEMPTESEMQLGMKNLADHGLYADLVLTHCCANSTQTLVEEELNNKIMLLHRHKELKNFKYNELTCYFEFIKQHIRYGKWIFGHYHDNICITPNEILIYEQIIRVA